MKVDVSSLRKNACAQGKAFLDKHGCVFEVNRKTFALVKRTLAATYEDKYPLAGVDYAITLFGAKAKTEYWNATGSLTNDWTETPFDKNIIPLLEVLIQAYHPEIIVEM